MPEFIAYLSDDEIVWGSFKVVGVDDRGFYNYHTTIIFLLILIYVHTTYT